MGISTVSDRVPYLPRLVSGASSDSHHVRLREGDYPAGIPLFSFFLYFFLFFFLLSFLSSFFSFSYSLFIPGQTAIISALLPPPPTHKKKEVH